MQVPAMLEGESLKRLLQGAAVGAVATIFVGFYWGGWSLGSTAEKTAKERTELAVIAALAPVCADKFRAQADAEAKQVALSKVDSHVRTGPRTPKTLFRLFEPIVWSRSVWHEYHELMPEALSVLR
jgi:hypothetical protein